MIDKKEVLLESIEKLLGLNIPDKEIVANLREIGVDSDEATDLIAEAKDGGVKKLREKHAEEKGLEEERARQLFGEKNAGSGEAIDDFDDSVFSKEPRAREPRAEKEREAEESRYSGREEKTRQSTDSSRGSSTKASESDFSRLWEKGIITTVDSKLEEMRRLKKEIEDEIEKKIEDGLKGEVKKINVLLESQRDLLVSKVNSELEKKTNELTSMIDGKIKELKEINSEATHSLSAFKTEQKMNEKLVEEANKRLVELDKTRSRIVAEYNASLIESKSKLEDLLKAVDAKISETDERINKALQLQSKINEGLVEDAQQKVENIALMREGELEKALREKLKELDEETEKVIQLQSSIDKDLVDKVKQKVEKIELAKENELEKELNKKIKEIDEVSVKISPVEIKAKMEKLNTAMDSLNEFKVQFVKVVKANTDSFQKTKKDWTEQMQQREKAIDEHIKAVDAKIAELTDFEKKFAEEIGMKIDEASETGALKKLKKK
ncbi:MAG: hypothetical protein V1494_00375 [Candidatus Diapherotrites archaeon]